MSELEKVRAVSFLSVLTIALALLSALHGDVDGPAPGWESIEICAMSKGALCEDAAAPHYASDDLGAPAAVAGDAIADIGSITVTERSAGRSG